MQYVGQWNLRRWAEKILRERHSKIYYLEFPPTAGCSNTERKTVVLVKERKWYVQHKYLLLCVVESNRLHVSTLHAGHLQAFTTTQPLSTTHNKR